MATLVRGLTHFEMHPQSGQALMLHSQKGVLAGRQSLSWLQLYQSGPSGKIILVLFAHCRPLAHHVTIGQCHVLCYCCELETQCECILTK